MNNTQTSSPGKIQMAQHSVYVLKVTRIHEARREFQKDGRTWYTHDLYVVDKHGNESRVEYVTPTMTIPINTIEQGVYQNFRCIQVHTIANLVEPIDPDVRDARRPPAPNIDQSGRNHFPPAQGLPQDASSRMYGMALSYAKDIKVAEIGKRKEGYQVTDGDIQDIARWGLHLFKEWTDFLTIES